jgi:hypothetical protein
VKQSENVLRYIAAASPETMLALLNEIAELEQRHCGTALLEREEMHTKTLGRMLDELDAKDKQIADLKEAFSIALSAAGIDVPAAAGKGGIMSTIAKNSPRAVTANRSSCERSHVACRVVGKAREHFSEK